MIKARFCGTTTVVALRLAATPAYARNVGF